MIRLKIKNMLRLIIGLASIFCQKKNNQFRIYINLLGRNNVGGPDRFLKNLRENVESNLIIENWLLAICDVALVFSSSWGDSFSKLCRLMGVRSVLRVDGFYVPDDKLDEEFQLDKKYQDFVNERLKRDLFFFDHVIYQSNFSKEICDRYLYERNNSYSIIPNGADLKLFTPKEIINKKIQLIILAKHYPKHLKLLIDILENLNDLQNYEVKLIGPMRNGEDKVEAFLDSLAPPPKARAVISCLGIKVRNELPEILSSGDIFLHLKVGDWCPNAVIEAMASGLPVVCPTWGGTRELVGDAGVNVDGKPWVIDTALAVGMARAIEDVCLNLKEFKTRARNRSEKLYDMDIIAEKYIQVLKYN